MATYEFMGCKIRNQGYHQPDHCVWWEATDATGAVVAHGKTLRECEMIILEDKVRRETEDRLKKERNGNAEEMRVALLRCEAISHLPEIREQQRVRDMRNIIADALSAPARNCDVGTAEEQAKRYANHCDAYLREDGGKPCTGCPCCGKIPFGKCEFAWAQMPYKEGDEK